MNYAVQQEDLDIVRQGEQSSYVKAELLSRDFLTVEVLEGELIQDNYSFNVDSDIRHTYNVTFLVNNSTFTIGRNNKIWLDKYIRLSKGIYHIRKREIKWYPSGLYILSTAGFSYNATTRQLSLSCLDRIAELSGERNGQISGQSISIPAQVEINGELVNNTIREAMIKTITQLGKIKNYRIEDIGGMTSVEWYTENVETSSDGNYDLYNIEYGITDSDQLKNGLLFAFKSDKDNALASKIKIDELPSYPIYYQKIGTHIDSNMIKKGIQYVVQYRKLSDSESCFFLLGDIKDGAFETKYKNGYVYQDNIPYDLDFPTGTHVWEIVKTLRDLYPGNETFFDGDTFVCQPIPAYNNAPVVLDGSIIDEFLIDEDTSFDFSQIKNVTEIYGKCLDSNYYTESVSMDSIGIYTLSYNTIKLAGNVDELTKGLKFAFKASADNIDGAQIKIPISETVGQTPYPILGENNVPIKAGRIKAGLSYVVQYKAIGNESYFYFMGQHQIMAICKLVSTPPSPEKIAYDLENEPTENIKYIVNPNSPFCSDFKDVGEIRQVLSGGDFDNIYSDELAAARASYENWSTTDWLNSLTINMLNIPWLYVNQKISYKLKCNSQLSHLRDNIEQEAEEYIIKSISGSSTNSVMSVNLVRYSPLYPWLQ